MRTDRFGDTVLPVGGLAWALGAGYSFHGSTDSKNKSSESKGALGLTRPGGWTAAGMNCGGSG